MRPDSFKPFVELYVLDAEPSVQNRERQLSESLSQTKGVGRGATGRDNDTATAIHKQVSSLPVFLGGRKGEACQLGEGKVFVEAEQHTERLVRPVTLLTM